MTARVNPTCSTQHMARAHMARSPQRPEAALRALNRLYLEITFGTLHYLYLEITLKAKELLPRLQYQYYAL